MGYIGFKMSIRAQEAYDDGEKPLSKWNKSDILKEIAKEGYDINILEKLTASEIKTLLLYKSSWHHTSSRYNKTDFYSINFEKIENLDIENIIKNREKKEKKEKEKIYYITAIVNYNYWTGTKKHPKLNEIRNEVVNFMSNEKLIKTENGTKRLSNLEIVKEKRQKTKFAKNI